MSTFLRLATVAPGLLLATLGMVGVVFLVALGMSLRASTPAERPAIIEALAELLRSHKK
ncbi:hypothetical protein POF50_025045 [Streptomyces sp. SL13]|uniref:Uncharacterized protein n=1 Tax=Streptantibioticus silvisoli TaxID=2705255 RepID=A0AA90KAW2_9ACTN|nr:hypothetical protein [Streptantibioticus silvisoli]MDI5972567.1 hypothetical protein [Streptantibioticus silvisoli]